MLGIDGGDLHRPITFDTVAGGGWFGLERLALFRGRSPGGGGDDDGGGAWIGPGETAWFHRVLFAESTAINGGGGPAVFAVSSPPTEVTIVECMFRDNVAEGAGGGGGFLLAGTGGRARAIRSTFASNRADHENGTGGAILAARGDLRLDSSTLSGNQANDGGRAVRVLVTGTGSLTGSLTVLDSTITDNLANADADVSGDGGGLDFNVGTDDEATLELHNSVVAGNLANAPGIHPDLACPDVDLVASGSGFIGSNAGCETLFPAGSPNAAGDFVGTSGAPLDPDLGPLLDNGGPLPTHEPAHPAPSLAGGVSPLIDNGSCPGVVTDQRGFGDPSAGLRPVDFPAGPQPLLGGDNCDIGAVEVDGEPGVAPTLFADGFEGGHTLLWTREVL